MVFIPNATGIKLGVDLQNVNGEILLPRNRGLEQRATRAGMEGA
jgi:hypothetical protein